MTTHIRHRRSTVAGAALPGLPMEVGELAMNLPDVQLFMSAAGTPQPMLGIRLWAATAKYLINDVVVYQGGIYKAKVANGPKAFAGSDWDVISAGTGTQSFLLPDGAVAAPSLAFLNETTLGVYRPGPGMLAIAGAGANLATFETTQITLAQSATLAQSKTLNGSGATAGSSFQVGASGGGGLHLEGRMAVGSVFVDVDAVPTDGTGAATARLFRNTNTTGQRAFSIFRGDGSALVDHQFFSASSGVLAAIARNGGRVLVGTATDDAITTLQVAGTLRQNGTLYGVLGVRDGGSYGGGGPGSWADSLVIENNANAGISILTPNTASGYLTFGDNDSNASGQIQYGHAADAMTFTTGGATRMALGAASAIFNQPIAAQPGTAAAPSHTFVGRLDQGLWSPSTSQLGLSIAGLDMLRMQQVAATGDLRIWTNTPSALWNLTGRSQVEINGSVSSLFGLSVAGAQAGSLSASANWLNLGTPAAAPTPITFSPGATERVRVAVAADPQLLIGLTATALTTLAGRALVEVNGSAQSALVLDVGGVATAFASMDTTSYNIGTLTAKPVVFFTGNGERARFSEKAYPELLLGSTTPLYGQSNRANLTLNGATSAMVAFGIGGGNEGYLLASGSAMVLASQDAANPIQFSVGGTRLTINSTSLMDSINGFELGWRDIPPTANNAALTAAARGMVVPITGTTYTVPTGQAAGSTICLVNMTAAAVTLTGFAGLHLAGTALTGNRTLGAWGFATIWYSSGTVAFIMGNVT